MSDEIKQVLESYISQERGLLTRHSQYQSQRKTPRTQLGREAINILARESLGRTGGKLVRTFIDYGDKQYRSSLDADMDTQHRRIINQLGSYLSKISELRNNLREPNSDKLFLRLERAQTGVRVDTRIRHTIKMLTNLKSKRLVYNKDLPVIPQSEAILPPGSPFTGLMELRKLLGSADGYVKICDTYVDVKTLDILNSVPPGIPIRLLTEKTGGSKRAPAFLRACKDFKVERPGFEIRKGEGLHDRFILMANRGWASGPSLKDFGDKFSSLTPLSGKGRREAERIFDDLWKKARVLIT